MPKDDPDKQARLADALRANLRRRKAQAREQDVVIPTHEPDAAKPDS